MEAVLEERSRPGRVADSLTQLGYDAAGRTKTVASSAGTTTLSYDYESRVTGIAYPGGATNAFAYNGLDTRVGKVDSGGTKAFRRDGAGVTDDVLSDGPAVYTPGVSQRRAGATTYELQDRMGSSVRQTDASRASTGARAYDAYGVQVGTDGTPVGPFGFAGAHGYQGDGDSGLKLLGHRYYDPSTGRFLTRDPIGDGRNWYGYGGGRNNPLSGVDPEGLGWHDPLIITVSPDFRGTVIVVGEPGPGKPQGWQEVPPGYQTLRGRGSFVDRKG